MATRQQANKAPAAPKRSTSSKSPTASSRTTGSKRAPRSTATPKTPTRTPSRPPSRPPTSRTTPTRASKASKASKVTPAPRPPKEPVIGPAVKHAFAGHGQDVWGLALIVIGIVMGLGLYADLAGPLGHGLATAAGACVGKASFLVPPALLALGALLMRGERVIEADEIAGVVDGPPRSVKPIVGSLLLLVSATGLLHLTGNVPSSGAKVDDFVHAGGYLGAATGVPLEKIVAVWGAGLILGALGIIALVIITDTTISRVMGRTADGVRPTTSAIHRGWQSMFELRSRDDELIGFRLDDPTAPPRPAATATPTADEGLRVVVGGEDENEDESGSGAGVGDEVKPKAKRKKKEPEAPAVHVPGAEDEPEETEQLAIDLGPAAAKSVWKLPPMKLLSRSEKQEIDEAEVEALGHTLEAALAAHGVETRLVGMVVGPTVTRFELELGPGVKVARVTSLHKDIAYAMASADVRILAPIPGRQAIGVEVPNKERVVVAVGDILTSEEARKATHPLEVAIGRDINGRSVLANLSTMPHVLIAGATGAGKSSCLNSLLTSILMRSTPDQVRMILIDPKRVELGQYNKLPHLLTQVVTNPKKAANALAWAVREMERRYDLLAEVGFRDINGYNAAFDRGDLNQPAGLFEGDVEDEGEVVVRSDGPTYERLPYIIIVVDELNDLMMVAARDVEDSICRIAQMARAVGVHLVIATQRPSVNVITGVIKANVPARLAFAVSSLADSRVILDQPGAERLVGKGDLLLLGPSSSVAQRIQGCWVSEAEVRAVVANWVRQAPDVQYLEGVEGTDDGAGTSAGAGGSNGNTSGDEDDEELLRQAVELVVRSQLGSTSMLQRKLRVGFARAGRLMDLMEQRGIVGPSEGSKARSVLMSPEELDEQPDLGE